MIEKVNQFWELLSSSGLLAAEAVEKLKAESPGGHSRDTAAAGIARLMEWVVSKGAITEYQASVFANGQATDFRYGEYILLDRVDDNPHVFLAQHTSGYCVVLKFLKGVDQDDALRWRVVRMRGDAIAACDCPYLLACFQTVKLAQHRMLVCESPSGKQLTTMLPAKSRIPSDQAFPLGLQLAQAVQQLHDSGITHKAISPATVWLLSKTEARLAVDPLYTDTQWIGNQTQELQTQVLRFRAPELKSSEDATLAYDMETAVTESSAAADIYSIGALLFRMTAGKIVSEIPQDQVGDELQQRDFPNWFVETIENLVCNAPEERMSAAELVTSFETNGIQLPGETSIAQDLKTDFRQTISKLITAEIVEQAEAPQLGQPPETLAEPDETIDITAENDLDEAPLAAEERIAKAQASIQRRQKLKWLQPILVITGCLAMGAVFASVYLLANQTQVSQNGGPDSNQQTNRSNNPLRSLPAIQAQTDPEPSVVLAPPIVQTLIPDDGSTIWETPTLGAPIDLDFLPPAPKIIVNLNPKQLLAKLAGQRIRLAMGEPFSQTLMKFEKSIGIPLADVDRLLLSYHQTDQNQYHWFAVVSCSKSQEQLKDAWGDLTIAKSPDGDAIYDSDAGLSYFFVTDKTNPVQTTSSPQTPDDGDGTSTSAGDGDGTDEQRTTDANTPTIATPPTGQPIKFLVGQNEFVRSVVDLGFGYPVAGSIKTLHQTSDSQRDLSLIFLRPSLFNDQGQNWMGENLAVFNRQLSELIPDEVSGGMLSFHADQGDYLELTLDRRVDITAAELETRIKTGISDRLQALVTFTQRIPPNEHWQTLQNRFGKMLLSMNDNTRWSSGGKQLTGNVWLPPLASHNLIAASELVAAFQRTAIDPDANQQQVPQTLPELLQAKRDLDIANPPDLNVLLAELEQEVNGDYTGLPFNWRIVLLGADLEKDGITKNQRPGPLKLNQKSFAEILTSIVVSANPDKDITGAADPNCKLIWVIAQDPDNPDQQAIMITTRAAAEKKSYQLPDPFVN